MTSRRRRARGDLPGAVHQDATHHLGSDGKEVGPTELIIGGSGKLYLAAILDLYSRFVVGWALSAVNDWHLALRALEMALKRRCPDAGLLHHSDQGCTYASEDYRARLAQHGITCSMSRRGNCFDNAVMENWFLTVKSEEGERLKATRMRKKPCSITLSCSITSDVVIRHSARSVQRNSTSARHGAWIPRNTAQNAVSHRLQTHNLSLPEKTKERKTINLRQPSTESDQAQTFLFRCDIILAAR